MQMSENSSPKISISQKKAIYGALSVCVFEFHSMEINLRNAFNTLYDPIFVCLAPSDMLKSAYLMNQTIDNRKVEFLMNVLNI